MEQWRSLEDITKAFDLPEGCSFATARTELLKLLAGIHPDRSSGEFASANDGEQFQRILNAIRLVDESKNKPANIVPYTERSTAILTMAREVRVDEAAFRGEIAKSAKSKYHRQRVGSAIVAAALLACVTFSDKLVGNPLISHLLSYVDQHFPLIEPTIGVFFLTGIVVAIVVVATAWRRENKAKMMTEALLTENGIAELFTRYPLRRETSSEGKFSSKDLVEAIQFNAQDYTHRRLPAMLPSRLRHILPHSWKYHKTRSLFADDLVLAQQAADLIIEKLELRGTVLPIKTGRLVRLYQLSAEAREGMGNEPF
jgi:hypothetical protein